MLIFNGWKSLLAIPVLLVGFVIGVLPAQSLSAGLIVGGALVIALGLYLNRSTVFEDPATGEMLRRKQRYGFFWIPVWVWGILIVALGIYAQVVLSRIYGY